MREVEENKNLLYRIRFKRSWCGSPSKRRAEQERKLLLAWEYWKETSRRMLFGLMNKTSASTNGTDWLYIYRGCK